MAKEKATPNIKKFQHSETLKCVLDNEELLRTGSELARALDESTALESELQSIKDSFKGKITTVDAKVSSLKAIVRDKCDYRKVDCEEIFDNDAGIVTKTRLDTGEIIDKRKMTAKERQSKMFDE
jgi:hypothetical protein